MNQQETTMILAVLAEAFTMGKHDPQQRVAVWHQALCDLDADDAMAATKHVIQTDTFPPSPARIREIVLAEEELPHWTTIKALIEASSHGRGLGDCHPIVRAVSAAVGGATSLAAMQPRSAEFAVRDALAACQQDAERTKRIAVTSGTQAIGGSMRMIGR